MNQRKREALANTLIDIAKNIGEFEHLEEKKRIVMFSKGGAYEITDKYAESYYSLLNQLLVNEKWSEKYSQKYLDNLLRNLILEAVEANDFASLGTRFNEIVENFDNYSIMQTVILPMAGIQMELPERKIGNINLVSMTENLTTILLDSVSQIVDSSPSSFEVKQSINEHNSQIIQSLRGKVCAIYQVVAEPKRAKERGEEEMRRVIDLIRFSIPAIYAPDVKVSVGLEGEIPERILRPSTVVSVDGSHFNIGAEVIGPLSDFKIDAKNIQRMEEIGVFDLSLILQKPNNRLSEFEKTLLRGVHWLSNSVTQAESENAFLNLISCLETFLTPRENNPIGTAIAEGTAIILGKGVENRRKLKKKIQKFYGSRSGISHGGDKAILDTDLAELRNIAGMLTVWMIEHRSQFQSINELLEWIETQKLG